MATIEQGSSGNLTPLLVGVNINPYTVLGNGSVTVTTAGTRVVMGASTSIKTITIRSNVANTGIIYVGTVSVTSANGFQLSPSETVSLDIDNLSKVYIDASVNTQTVTYITLS